jgi:hypothetical protein
MLITIWCIVIIVISIVAIGAPLRWLLNGRSTFGAYEWIEVPFLGIAAIILILQNLVYLDLRIHYTAALIWVLALLGWALIYRARQIGAVFAAMPKALFGTALAIYLLQGIGLLIVGARFYVGRAWGDQYNYTVIAQFLADERFSTSLREVGNRPYLVNAINLKWDRIGQSILHGFFAISSLQDAKTLFEPAILLSPALIVLSVYALSRRFSLHHLVALAVAATAGILPGVAAIHLESFLSQALAVPMLLLLPVLLDRLFELPSVGRLATCAIIAAAMTSIYTEFWAILLILTLLMIGLAALASARGWRLLSYWFVLALAPFILNPGFATGTLSIFTRIDKPVLGNIYPWAFTIEGIGRLWLGDLAVGAPPLLQSGIRAYSLAALALGYYGLLHVCVSRLANVNHLRQDPEQRRSLAFAAGVLALALLPAVIIARDDQHPYQFYKLLLSICPLLVLGIALVFQPQPGAIKTLGTISASNFRVQPALLAMGLLMAGGMAGTTAMTLQSTTLHPNERYTGHYLIAPELRQVQERLEALHDSKLFFYQTDSTWSTGFVNAWLAYFARDNQIWLGNRYLNGRDLAAVPETKAIVDLHTLPEDILLLSSTDPQLAALSPEQAPLWASATYRLWKPDGAYWLLPLKLENKNGFEQLDGESFLWMGQGETVAELIASRSGTLRLHAKFSIGPSGPALLTRTLQITTTAGYQQRILIASGKQSILIPVQAGMNKIVLQLLDQPTIVQQPNGDTRPLLLGIHGLTLTLNETPVIIDVIDNPNGLETVDKQSFFWIGQGDSKISILSGEAGQLRLTATFLLGPSAPDLNTRRVLVSTNHGDRQTVIVGNGLQSILTPIRVGTTIITLRALDRPSVARQSNGDTRPLMLGVQGLRVALKS